MQAQLSTIVTNENGTTKTIQILSNSKDQKQVLKCRHFARLGYCSRGSKCAFSHDDI